MPTLYALLGCAPTATSAELKRAYHKQALRVHPDKNHGDAKANERFQQYALPSFLFGRPSCAETPNPEPIFAPF